MKFKRMWDCAMCGKEVIYDSEAHTITCGCGVVMGVDLPEESLRWNYKRIEG